LSLPSSFLLPFRSHNFLWLFAVFILNGTAAAMPATLVTFFVADVVRAEAQTGLFLVLYFLAGAACMPLWIRFAARWGAVPAWMFSMVLAVIAFVWAYGLEAGDISAYAVVCLLSGLALGADLALPPAMLAEIISQEQHQGEREGAYFGVWNFAAKLNLALAAGISLPLLGWLGYDPHPSSSALADTSALSVAYAVIPCLIKLSAAAVLLLSPLKTQLKPH
jgi:Na+/melibiose symporter-like transporter